MESERNFQQLNAQGNYRMIAFLSNQRNKILLYSVILGTAFLASIVGFFGVLIIVLVLELAQMRMSNPIPTQGVI